MVPDVATLPVFAVKNLGHGLPHLRQLIDQQCGHTATVIFQQSHNDNQASSRVGGHAESITYTGEGVRWRPAVLYITICQKRMRAQ